MNDLLKDLAAIPSFDLEVVGWGWQDLVEQKWGDAADYLQRNDQLPGDWIRSEDVISLLKKHNLL
jgi:hypothetical protein